ncbi:F-box only protein 22 [Paramormyrops kingsleyae]|uniref:F-box only protein 22 n=1 Tax=Paramormyrops kingsleyae TaxID=1676925 RepID=UPI000CD5E476|nr:F-box only protein 22 [Paramormyrops kingsleyae]
MDVNTDCLNAEYGSKAGYILSNVAEVVERILTFVPTKSLLRSACVCRLWRNCARRVLRTQQQLGWVSATGSSSSEGHVLYRTLAEEVENIYLLPQTVLLMADSETINGRSYWPKKAKTMCSSDVAEDLKRLFPKGCDILGIATPGIVLTPSGQPSSQPQEHQEGEAGFALMIPSMDGVTIRPFHFCKQTLSKTALEEAGLVGDPELRVVLLFGYQAFKAGGPRFLHHILQPLAQSSVLVAGGHVESVFSHSRICCGRGSYGVVGLTLSGPRVQGASVLLDQDVTTEKAAEAAVQRLKAASIPEHNTLGFMFACVGRGQNYYNQRDVEVHAFRKVFPSIPLFGFFGNGEIGCDRIVTGNYMLTNSDADGLQHGFTTVMTLVHLG